MATNISEFKNLVAPDVLPCPDPIVERETVGAILEFCSKTNILQKTFNVDISSHSVTTTTQNSMDIDVSTILSGYRVVSVLDIWIDSVQYEPYRKEFYNTVTNYDQMYGSQMCFFYLTSNTVIRLYDRSESEEDLDMTVAVKPLRTAATVDDFLFEDFGETIANLAKYQILRVPGQPWYNPQASDFYYVEARRGMSKAKARVEKGFTNVSQRVNWVSFGDLD
jgi:hypothetical protein